eukprot:m.132753 g.132753  ORF g.132753 m.132753 type:complete len:72 (-) comp29629_c0_seq1:244-459(-)
MKTPTCTIATTLIPIVCYHQHMLERYHLNRHADTTAATAIATTSTSRTTTTITTITTASTTTISMRIQQPQ